ncbi:short-chain dehydrogenase [Paenibacillus sp. BGI2013]|uniref:SDR family NAD(P)-dependent oxidoreductase n=1 Tax=Paenibacillus amylolyticus TaxID=1451 RepID=A0ABD8AP11_PAEAM|nr:MULTISPECIES: SDR family NAD(P)-dependent oxidoreductase [Paenibacillus]ETT39055.1 short chain dehydrogenase/reductase [Paenibacillus sp. FSL R5-192]ETT42064.1 short chain dehydrogenase/reductase [Paenibacillus sp. FSL H7-689]PKQ87656.1 short-chain dehydrogenase [Paenibacillus sp. BGI2013]
MKNIIVFGASKGLGDAFVRGVPQSGDKVWVVSRSKPESLSVEDGVERIWIQADLSELQAAEQVASQLQGETLDVLIYNVGIWEKEGFEEHYTFDKDEPADISQLIHVNVTSTIVCIQALLPQLRQSEAGKIILIGSTAGLSNAGSSQVSFVASKFAIRGITEALREHTRNDRIAVTCINPGELAAEIPYEDGMERALAEYDGTRIPLQDMVSIVRCIISLSKAACVKEINMPALTDTNT